jgi:hypothetical protein
MPIVLVAPNIRDRDFSTLYGGDHIDLTHPLIAGGDAFVVVTYSLELIEIILADRPLVGERRQ